MPDGSPAVRGWEEIAPNTGSALVLATATWRVTVAVVPIGGWGPRLSPGHMDATQAATAVARSGARYAVPVHWGTLHPPLLDRWGTDWLDEPGHQFAEALAQQAPDCRAVVLAPGEDVLLEVSGRSS